MNIRPFVAVISAALLVHAASADVAAQTVVGRYWWMKDASSVTAEQDVFTPQSATVTAYQPTAAFTANPKAGCKVTGWYCVAADKSQARPSDFTSVAGAVNGITWTKDDAYGSSVMLGLQFEWIRYTLAYEGGGSASHLYTDSLTIASCSQTRPGYAFSGAWTNAAGNVFRPGEQKSGGDFHITAHADGSTVRLYPEWTANTYQLAYDLGPGAPSGSYPESATYDAAFTLADPVRTGYRLVEWTVTPTPAEGSGAKVERVAEGTRFLNLTQTSGDTVTLAVVWTNCSYKVTFNNHGATSEPEKEMTVEYDRPYGAVNTLPQKSGYEFCGYFTAETGGEMIWNADGQSTAASWKIVGDITAHARWKAEEWDIEYNANGGEGLICALHVTNNVATVLSDGTGFSRAGCRFLGWAETATGSVKYQPGAGATFTDKNLKTLYAVWEESYFVAYDGHGATGGEMAQQKFLRNQEAYLLRNTYVRPGYTFIGWANDSGRADSLTVDYTDGQAVKNLSDVPGSTTFLYAVWKTNTYYVAFNRGWGSGDSDTPMEPMKFVYDETQRLAKCSFKAPGTLYDFVGWENPLNGEIVPDEAVVSNLCTVADGTNTLKAIWRLTVSDLSKAMHCTTLNWETNHVESGSGPNWTIQEDGFGVSQIGGGLPSGGMHKDWLTVTVTTNGILSFKYYLKNNESAGTLNGLLIGFQRSRSEYLWDSCYGIDPITINEPAGEWVSTNIPVTIYKDPDADWKPDPSVIINLVFNSADPDNVVVIDQVKWIPEGGQDVPVEPDPAAIAVPQAMTGLHYDGKEHVGVPTGEGYWITGNAATLPGDYVATATPLYGYCWEDGTTNATDVSWTIAKGLKPLGSVSFQNATFTYDGALHSLVLEGTLPDGVTVRYDGELGRVAAGTNVVTAIFTPEDPDRYELDVPSLTATLIVKKGRKSVEHVKYDDVVCTYDGQSHALVFTNDLPAGVELVFSGDATNRVEAGTNVVTVGFRVMDPANWEEIVETRTVKLIVNRGMKDMSGVTLEDASFDYDGKPHALAVTGEVPPGVTVVYDPPSATEPGSYSVIASFTVDDEKNWEPIDLTLGATLTINAPPTPVDPRIAYENIYFFATLAELGVPSVPVGQKLTAEGLPKGLKLVKQPSGEYAIEGVPTETLDGVTRLAYVRVKDGSSQTLHKLDMFVLPASAKGECILPDGTNGVEYAVFSLTNFWPNPTAWKVSGLPAGLLYGASQGEVYGVPTKPGRFVIKAVETVPGKSYKSTHVAEIRIWPDDGEPDVGEWTDRTYEEIAEGHRAVPRNATAASGLPKGVKFAKDGGQFNGKPTKAGTYVVKLTHADGSTTRFLWTILAAEPPSFDLLLTNAAVSPEAGKATVRQGVAYDWAITNSPGAKVSVKGLPKGLKLVSVKSAVGKLYAVRGAPTKAGEYTAIFKTTMNGAVTVVSLAFTVEALPDWAQGTFNGGEAGLVSFTVSKTGKISGKYMRDGATWKLTAPSYDSFDGASPTSQAYRVTLTGKGGSPFTCALTVFQDALGGVATNDLFIAYQNKWKSEPWKSIGKRVAKSAELTIAPKGFGEGDSLQLKFAAGGSVKIKGMVAGQSVKGSAVLCPQTEPDADGSFAGVVFVYLPPKAGTPFANGFSDTVLVTWNGAAGAFQQLKPTE